MLANEVRESLQTVCSVLNNNQVDYIVVGGVAVGYHGYQRISGGAMYKPEIKLDLDFWYKPTTDNFINLVDALGKLGVNNESLNKIVFDPKKTFLKIPHANFQTDFLPIMAGLGSFQDCKKNASLETVDGNNIHILSYQDLIKNKAAVSRPVDKLDIIELEKINNTRNKGFKR